MSGHSKRNAGHAAFTILEDPPMTPQKTNGVISPNGFHLPRVAPDRSSAKGDDIPGKPYIGPNITPRSGARRARHESVSPQASSTPHGVTKPMRPLSAEKRQGNGGGYKIPKDVEPHDIPIPTYRYRSGSVSSDGSDLYAAPSNGRYDVTKSPPPNNGMPKFFHASNAPLSNAAKSTSVEATSRPQSVNSIGPRPTASKPSPLLDEDRSKFFYASEIKDAKAIPPLTTTSPHIPTLNGVSKKPQAPIVHPDAHPYTPQPFRPSSPLKEEILMDSPESLASSPTESPEQAIESEILSRRSSVKQPGSKVPRPSSLSSPTENRKSAHSRKSSLNAPTRARKSSLSTVQSEPDGVRSPPMPRLSRLFETEDSPSSPPSKGLAIMSPPLSPVKGQSQLEHLNELAAKARRERKVLDLEISNSSLLAINQTLEREMRKMKSELRQLRRLSRPSRIPSSSLRKRDLNTASQDVEDESSESSESEGESEDDDSSLLSTSKSAIMAKRSADEQMTVKFKDRNVAPLDLSKQQKLLEDGQSLNMKIRRCLGFSEELLRSGKDALEVKAASLPPDAGIFGPRVLSPDEIQHEVGEMRQGLLTPVLDRGSLNPWERTLARSQDSSPESVEAAVEGDSVDSIDPAIYDASTESPVIHQEEPKPSQQAMNDDEDSTSELSSEASSTPSILDSPSPLPVSINPVLKTPPRAIQDSSEALRKLQGTSTDEAQKTPPQLVGTMPPPPPPPPQGKSATSSNDRASSDKDAIAVTAPAPLNENKEESEPTPSENTAGNRSSVTKYLASFWSGATKIRPP